MLRRLLILAFVGLATVSILISFYAFRQEQWEVLTASISLLIAIIAAWVSYETLYRQSQVRRAQLILSVDFSS